MTVRQHLIINLKVAARKHAPVSRLAFVDLAYEVLDGLRHQPGFQEEIERLDGKHCGLRRVITAAWNELEGR